MTQSRVESNLGAPPDAGAYEIAEGSYRWYASAAVRSRRRARSAEVAVLVGSASIAVSVALWPDADYLPTLLGLAVTLATGAGSIFRWRDNYVRFSTAREAINRELRLYRFGGGGYDDDATKDRLLMSALSTIESAEMNGWLQVTPRAD